MFEIRFIPPAFAEKLKHISSSYVPELVDGGLALIINEVDDSLTRPPDVREDHIGNNYRLLCRSYRPLF
jgi:hypothetical protein